MSKKCRWALALGSAGVALALGLAPQRARASTAARYHDWRTAAARALVAQGGADALATAAALYFAAAARSRDEAAAGRSLAVKLADKASELDPNNASIGWLRLELCAGTAGCDIRDAATTMRWVDADNSAVWMATLAAAQKDKDAGEVTRVLQQMAQGSRFDAYRNRTVVLLFDTLRRADKVLPVGYVPSDLSRLSESMALAGAEIVPPFAPLLAACREPAAADRRDSCLKLARTMQRGDTVAAQMAGLTIEKRLLPPDSRQARAVAERRRVLEWRVSAASQYDAPALPWLTNALARARVRQMRATPREEDVDIAILRRHKIPLEPPENPR